MQDGHAHGHAVGHLLEGRVAGRVGRRGADLEAPVHRPRVHHERLREALEIIKLLWSGGYQSYEGKHLQLDARAAGVGAAVIAAWRKAPLIAVIVIGAAVTAAVRAGDRDAAATAHRAAALALP